MGDTRQHRGPHPQDEHSFGTEQWPRLQSAVRDLSWLLTRGYALPSALKLVGDRYQLTERQRRAVLRSSCSDTARARRHETQIAPEQLAGESLEIDGFNLLTTIEAALAGGVLLRGRDGAVRDMASMHGSYRKVAETRPAIEMAGQKLEGWQVGMCRWWFDRPVSNSGRLSALVREVAAAHGWDWQTALDDNPDHRLKVSTTIVVSADSAILDVCGQWCNLARLLIERCLPDAWLVPLDTTAADRAPHS